jgi:hypothetical protein
MISLIWNLPGIVSCDGPFQKALENRAHLSHFPAQGCLAFLIGCGIWSRFVGMRTRGSGRRSAISLEYWGMTESLWSTRKDICLGIYPKTAASDLLRLLGWQAFLENSMREGVQQVFCMDISEAVCISVLMLLYRSRVVANVIWKSTGQSSSEMK